MTTYYVRTDGTAATIAAAVGPASDSSKCMNMTVFNAGGFAAGDTVLFSGEFSNKRITVPDSGDVGNPITYGSADMPSRPTFTYNGAVPFICGRSNAIIQDINFVTTSNQLMQLNATQSNITIRRVGLTGTSYGIVSSAKMTNLVIQDVTGSAGVTPYLIYTYGTASSGITVQRVTSLCGGVRITNATNVIAEDISVTAAPATYYGLSFGGCGGSVSVRRIALTNGLDTALNIGTSAFTAGIFEDIWIQGGGGISVVTSSGFTIRRGWVKNNTANSSASVGFTTSFAIAVEDFIALDNRGDGFDGLTASHDITLTRCQSLRNGTKLDTTTGDGYSFHDTCYNIVMEECTGIGNACSGVAHVGTSAGIIRNCLFTDNAGDWRGVGGADQIRGGMYFALNGNNATSGKSWIVKNTICANNYPCEVALTASTLAIIGMDYNCYNEKTAGNFANLDADVTYNYVTWTTYASRETHSIHAAGAIDANYIPTPGGNCDGTGDPSAMAGVGGSDLYGRPRKLASQRISIGPVECQRNLLENTLQPVVQTAIEAAV